MYNIYNLFLDDYRMPSEVTWIKYPISNEKWTIVRNYDEFVKIINERGIPDCVSFDHDLSLEHAKDLIRRIKDDTNNDVSLNYDSYEEKTGYDCAKFLVNYCIDNNKKFPTYFVHSMNPIGAENIENYIENYNRTFDK